MATFNTAFGSLPSPKKDLFGNAPMGGDDDDDYTKGFAPGSTTEKTAAAPPPTNTFADLQKQGVARPAPRDTAAVSPEFDAAAMTPMLSQLQERLPEAAPEQPEAAPMAGPQAVPMLGQLQQSLSGMAAPDAGEIVLSDGSGGAGGIGNVGGGGGGAAGGGGTPPPPPPPPPTMGYSATGGITGTPTIDKDTNTATYTNVEVPVSNAPQYKAGTVPPPTAPNGSTFVSGSGVTWTKRGGVWGVEGSQPTGYAALTPPELAAQTQANLPSGAAGFGGTFSSEPGQGSGLYQFMRRYGTPTSDAEFATLAQQAGKTVEQLKSYISSQPASLRFDTKRNVDTNAEEQAWKKENKVGFVPENYAFVPVSEGGPRLRKKSYEEMVAAGYQPYGGKSLYDSPANDLRLAQASGTTNLLRTFGGLAGGSTTGGGATGGGATGGGTLVDQGGGGTNIVDQGGGGGTDFIGGGGAGPGGPGEGRPLLDEDQTYYPDRTPPSMVEQPRTPPGSTGGGGGGGGGGGATGGGTPANAGAGSTVPRTAYTPPVAGAMPIVPTYAEATDGAAQFSLSAQSQALRDALQARLAELGSGPTKIQGQSYEALRAARQAELGAKYGAERSKLEDELAARGLSASTIGGGRYGDLAGQQARALGTLDAELLGQQAEAEARDRALYLNTMQQFAQTTGQQDIGTFESNVKSRQLTADINLRASELQQRAALEGRSLDLQQARDQATSEYQMSQLALSTDELAEQIRRNEVLDRTQTGELTLRQGIAVNELLSDIYEGRAPAYAWETTLKALGLKPADFVSIKPEAKTPATTTTTTTTDPNNPNNVIPPRKETAPPATTLSNYTTGTRFNIRGVIYTLDSSGRLIDPFGKQYNYSNDE